MCTGRVDLAFVLHAFAKGADGVFIGGCWPGECHYITEGNYDALGNTYLGRRLLARLGIRPERLRLEWIAASEGSRFAEVTTDFVRQVQELGPLGTGEGLPAERTRRTLTAVTKLTPYLKLVERERLRPPERSVAGYDTYFAGPEFQTLFESLVADKLAQSRITALLEEGPLSTEQIAEQLRLTPSEVSRHMHASSRHGLVSYDIASHRYELA